MKKWLVVALGATLLASSSVSYSANLVEVYREALQSDPTFKAAEAQWLAQSQLLPISRAALLPNLSANGTVARNRVDEITNAPNAAALGKNGVGYSNSAQYGLNLNQSIFNFASWMAVRNAQATVKQAEANYSAAAQDLMIRVAQAYFDVLQAYDDLQTTQAEKRSLSQQLQQTEERYRVGLIAITGVNQIQASYDATVANEIAAKNVLANKLEELHAITDSYYPSLAGPTNTLPLVIPKPANINAWVAVAGQQNYTLQAANFAAEAAHENVKEQAASNLPTVSATGGYNYNNQTGAGMFDKTKTATVGVTVSLPIVEGGLVTAQTRQASYQYAQASAQVEEAYRSTVTQTREAYLGVMSGISQIKADKQAIISSESSLKATEAGYEVGTNTIVDVLEQQSSLYTARRNFDKDQYQYLLNTLTLKQAAGTLSQGDLAIINSWLKQTIMFKPDDTSATASTINATHADSPGLHTHKITPVNVSQ